jgi:hypothetical protein
MEQFLIEEFASLKSNCHLIGSAFVVPLFFAPRRDEEAK